MKILVIEPHPDDAFISLGWHLEKLWAKDERTILTVYATPRRAKEAEAYAQAIGASSIVLGLSESPMGSLGPIRPERALRQALGALKWDRILFPLGLQHPDHLRVAATRTGGAERYLDLPYAAKLKLAESLSKRAEEMRTVSICFPPKRKWRYAPIFKSQSKFFYFNPLQDYKLPEIVLK